MSIRTTDTEPKTTVAPMAYAAVFAAAPMTMMPFLFPLPLLFGLLALRDIARHPHYTGKGRAVFGIVWGVLGLILTAFLAVVMLAARTPA